MFASCENTSGQRRGVSCRLLVCLVARADQPQAVVVGQDCYHAAGLDSVELLLGDGHVRPPEDMVRSTAVASHEAFTIQSERGNW